MARVTFINSILSGKLAGMVFANNKAGEYVRQYRKGTDPATTAQLNNRAAFVAASTSWHSLTDAQKAVWNTFAVTNFKPKLGSSGVRFSGFNAFVSTQNVANNMNRISSTVSISDPAAATIVSSAYFLSPDAPTAPLSSAIRDAAGHPLNLVLTSFILNGAAGSGVMSFDLLGSVGPGPQSAAVQFQDAIGHIPVGIAIVASLPIVQNQQFVQNPEINIVAATPVLGAITGWTSINTISIDTPAPKDYLLRKLGYQTGDLVQFKAYLIGQNGMTQPLNAVKNVVI